MLEKTIAVGIFEAQKVKPKKPGPIKKSIIKVLNNPVSRWMAKKPTTRPVIVGTAVGYPAAIATSYFMNKG